MRNRKSFFSKVEKYKALSTILFRSIELKLLKEKFGHLFKTKKILDLGCGKGIAASVLFDRKVSYGLDNNPAFVKQAKKSGIYKKVILADATKVPLQNKSLNLVFSNCVIEHIKDLDLVLKEINRLLRKDGIFIFTAPSNHFKNYSVFSYLKLTWLANIYGRLRNRKYRHYHSYSLKKWSPILKKSGFKLIDGYYYINKKTLEFWDFLLISRLFYKILFRRLIYKKFIASKITSSDGAAVCVAAQKR